MKKFIVFLMFLSFPLNIYAYSDTVYLGGETIGIDIKSNGVMVVGFYKVSGNYPKTSLIEGDIIKSINGTSIASIKELTLAIEEALKLSNTINITYLRAGKEFITTLDLIKDKEIYKTGLYVKDSITGIGTLTFIDSESHIYGALGHEILEVNTNQKLEIKSGSIFENSITSIKPSSNGNPGSKNAKFYYQNTYGDITKNTKVGIYGKYTAKLDPNNLISIAKPEEITVGPASIYTVLNNETVEEFTINIKSINENSETKNLTFEITDSNLLNKTGGIIQGMSGSPIVQNGKLIGAVTHVITDNVKSGYGIFITTMLEESEK